jgi:hypothetical protein
LLELKKGQKERGKNKKNYPKQVHIAVGYIIILITTSQPLIGNTNTSCLYRLVVEQIAQKRPNTVGKKNKKIIECFLSWEIDPVFFFPHRRKVGVIFMVSWS